MNIRQEISLVVHVWSKIKRVVGLDERPNLVVSAHLVETGAKNVGHPAAPGCSPCYFPGQLFLERTKLASGWPTQQHFYTLLIGTSTRTYACEVLFVWPKPIPGSWSRMWSGTLRSQGQTWQRISSVSSPPSLIAILLKAATSTGLTLRACVMSFIFFLRLLSPSRTWESTTSSESLPLCYRWRSSYISKQAL